MELSQGLLSTLSRFPSPGPSITFPTTHPEHPLSSPPPRHQPTLLSPGNTIVHLCTVYMLIFFSINLYWMLNVIIHNYIHLELSSSMPPEKLSGVSIDDAVRSRTIGCDNFKSNLNTTGLVTSTGGGWGVGDSAPHDQL